MDNAETFRPVPGFDGRYEVSNMGRVRSFARQRPIFLVGKVRPDGHREVLLSLAGKRFYRLVYVLMLQAFIGPRPGPGYDGCHNDGKAHNDVLSNLRWDTRKGNIHDQYLHGTANHAGPGEAHHGAKLWNEAIRVIRAEPGPGAVAMLAAAFDVSARQIRDVRAFRQWPHIRPDVRLA